MQCYWAQLYLLFDILHYLQGFISKKKHVFITLFLMYCLYYSLILTGISFELQTIIALFQKSSLAYNFNEDDDNEDEK